MIRFPATAVTAAVKSVVLAFALLAAAGARADLTIEGKSTPGADGGTDRYVIYVKDEQMRIDQLAGAEGDSVTSSMLIRFTGSPPGTLFLDHEARTVTVLPDDAVREAEQAVSARSDAGSGATPIARKDETKEVMGRTTEGYDFRFSGTATPPGMEGQQMPPGMADMLKIRLDVNGTAWVAPGLDGADELAAFYRKMEENQMTFGGAGARPRAEGPHETPTYPGIASGLTRIMADIAAKGFPLRTEMTSDVSVDAQGPMAGMMEQMMSGAAGSMGKSTYVSEVTGVSTDSVASALFFDGGLPEGYTQKDLSAP